MTLVPGRRVCSWLTYVVGPPELGLIVVRDEEVPLPRRAGSLEVRGDGLWAELVCETPFEHWGIALEAFGLRVDTPADDVGERLAVGLDLEWEVIAPAEPCEVGDGTGYRQRGVAHGELLVGDERIQYDAGCRRDHAWGRISPEPWPPRLPD
jgi:hypothetical protein